LFGLAKYLAPPQKAVAVIETVTSEYKSIEIGNVRCDKTGKALSHNFRAFTSVGKAKELLYSDVQEMLSEYQKEIGFEYIKFHGILSDDMMLYSEDENGNARYSFVMIDKAIDFLLSIGLKPLIQLSFMPQQLASDKTRNAWRGTNISKPSDMGKWHGLIFETTAHFVQRYGIDTVAKWLFCVWNEPNFEVFGNYNLEGGAKEFFELYHVTRDAVKKVSHRLRFGMPAIAYTLDFRNWLGKFIAECKKNDAMPEFCNVHYYDNNLSDEDFKKFSETVLDIDTRLRLPYKLNNNENAFRSAIGDIHKALGNMGLGGLPVYMTEWNMTVSHRNLLNDTCFKSCYIAKNLLENYDRLDSFGYWVLTDFIEETQPANEHFHGGLGLYTCSGIKKPVYYTFSFLNRLGDRLLARGEGYFITKSPGKIQAILYNYEHFSHLFASGETFDMSFTKRYEPFSKLTTARASLKLCGLPAKDYLIREHILNQQYGSAFDSWIEMGAAPIGPEDVEYLKQTARPRLQNRIAHLEKNGVLDITAVLEPLEVRLIEVEGL
jgi:xylan 1,4-beta-xylosidase